MSSKKALLSNRLSQKPEIIEQLLFRVSLKKQSVLNYLGFLS